MFCQWLKTKREIIIPKYGAKPLAPYSPAIKVGQFVYTSGLIGINPKTGGLVNGGVKAETRQALENLGKLLEAAGSSFEGVIKVTLFLSDIEDYGLVNDVYGEFFTVDPPARSIIQGKLPAGAFVEIDAVALI